MSVDGVVVTPDDLLLRIAAHLREHLDMQISVGSIKHTIQLPEEDALLAVRYVLRGLLNQGWMISNPIYGYHLEIPGVVDGLVKRIQNVQGQSEGVTGDHSDAHRRKRGRSKGRGGKDRRKSVQKRPT